MSPPRRRSARIAGTAKSTKAVPELMSVTEDAEPVAMSSPRRATAKSPMPAPSTPPSSAIKPPRSEMHPSKFHQSTGEPSSAIALGFTDIDAPDRRTTGTALTATPSRSTGMPTSSFTFDLATSTNGGALSSDAKKIMEELQEKAAKIKVELVAQREAQGVDGGVAGDRRFAKPKSLAGRYSAVHAAEFDKMESIEGHASAWRASRFTPVVAGVKRSPSKASLTESPNKPTDSPSPRKTALYNHLSETPKKNLKRKSSAANLDGRSGADSPKKSYQASSPSKPTDRTPVERQPVKRVKQRKEDDTSTSRPKISTTPTAPRTVTRPQSTLSRLMSPTKSSRMHRTASPVKATTSSVLTPTKLPISPRKPTISVVSTPKPSASPVRVAAPPTPSFAQSLSASNLTCKADGLARRILSPTRMQKVKSILRSQPTANSASGSAIPQPALYGSHTPAPPRVDKELPPVPFTTPRRKLTKKVTFTPETKRAAADQSSPTPLKSSLFRFRSASGPRSTRDVEMKNAASEHGGHVAYPDLSAFKDLIDSKDEDGKKRVPSVPSSFTFRSDHTIEFGAAPKTGFGSSVGQSSVRHVRQSLSQAASLPGSFPAPAPSSHPDKENTAPTSSSKVLPGVLHGLTSKKRHRPSTDEEDAEREAAERAAKKRKNTMAGPERPALSSAKAISSTPRSSTKRARLDRNASLTPSRQQLSRTPTATPGSATSPTKKKQGISMSRLQTLARPKTRA